MKKPLVSILMTIYNHESFLNKSIKSVINQTFKNWELIAIDNGSEDKSSEVLQKISDKRIKKKYLKKNIGRTNCLNYGLKFCKGKYIAILDSGCPPVQKVRRYCHTVFERHAYRETQQGRSLTHIVQ